MPFNKASCRITIGSKKDVKFIYPHDGTPLTSPLEEPLHENR